MKWLALGLWLVAVIPLGARDGDRSMRPPWKAFRPTETYRIQEGVFKAQARFTAASGTFRPEKGVQPERGTFRPPAGSFTVPAGQFKPQKNEFRGSPGQFYIGRGFLARR